jgi:hypothetical protein
VVKGATSKTPESKQKRHPASSALKTRREVQFRTIPRVPHCTEKALVHEVNGIEEIIRASFKGLSLQTTWDVAPIRKISSRVTEMEKSAVGAQVENKQAQPQRSRILFHFPNSMIGTKGVPRSAHDLFQRRPLMAWVY